nr:allatostatin-A [Urechis unicinctus]
MMSVRWHEVLVGCILVVSFLSASTTASDDDINDVGENEALTFDEDKRAISAGHRYMGLGKRPAINSALRYAGIGKRTMAPSMRYMGLGKRPSLDPAMRFAGLGKRTMDASLKYIGLGKRPMDASMKYIGLGKRVSGETSAEGDSLVGSGLFDTIDQDEAADKRAGMSSAFRFAGLGKRGYSIIQSPGKRSRVGNSMRFMGLGKRDDEDVDDYVPLVDYYQTPGGSDVSEAKRQVARYWSTRRARIDPTFRMMGIGRK